MSFTRDAVLPIAPPGAEPIVTERLRLVPATLALARAELEDRAAFAALLDAHIPDAWPPQTVAEALPLFALWLQAAPACGGWFSWYALARHEDGAASVLVASGGFIGPPLDGEVAVGYAVLPQFEGRGYATEMAGALVDWALAQPRVERVIAETEWANPASVRVLSKLGFVRSGNARAAEGLRFERGRDAAC
ncbi:GNAT family N-acetyltransferase [Lysobacter capsici]|uniref:GNAT family N-acetyltransferase n=1 Tax=Lysobacter capsici TaxID=435897 RepID=UPI00287BC93B|nr:GNAT family N-acetyltransferase [Lysobacter capsici]WND79733.1 GNAT family N-acetyltransferase [Lysobacter capsici]WND84929.1 GNAT family N-acetyltransferase [Lysobacter capsici]